MLTQADNELLCLTAPTQVGGDLLRRYWQPIALSSDIPPGSRPIAIRIMSEDLTLFREEDGQLGLIDLHCAHRGADLSYGRLEDGGLRCLYHGWLFDKTGQCKEQPGEPGNSFAEKVSLKAYPTIEKAGLIFAYLGPGAPPLLPAYEPLNVPEEHRWVAKYYHDCNYLQANEGNYDPCHPMFLHGFLEGATGTNLANAHPKENHVFRPEARLGRVPVALETEDTDFGVRSWAMRNVEGTNERAVTLDNFIMPNLCAVQGGPGPLGDGYLIYWHVPINDHSHWRYAIAFKRSGPLDPSRGARRTAMLDEKFRFPNNPANRYLQNREEMIDGSFSGFGSVFIVGDHWATETAGSIQDRTQEHLGASDRQITAARKMLFRGIRAIQAGEDPPHVIRSDDDNSLLHIQVWEEIFDSSVTLEQFRALKQVPTSAHSKIGFSTGGH